MSSFQSENEQLPRSPPMAVLPLNASAKLDQEPNPFEQSFSSLSKDDNGCSKCDTARSNSDNRSNGGAANNGSSSLSSSSSSGEPNTTTSHHATTTDKPSLPSVADLTSPVPPLIGGGILPKDVTNHLAWDSLRTGPLSPSMLQGPLNPAEFGTIAVTNPAIVSAPYLSAATQRPIMDGVGIDPLSTTSTFGVPMQGPNNYVNARSASLSNAASVPSLTSTATIGGSMPAKQTATVSAAATTGQNVSKSISVDSPSNSPARKNTRRKAATAVDQDDKEAPKPAPRKRARTNASVKEEDDEKRRNFLERNRIAALKCRQRKKQWLNDLQKKAEYLASDNEQLQMQANSLREELINLKTLLLAHKDCPVSRANAQAAAAGGNPGLPSEATSNGGTTVACGSSQSPNNLAVPPVSSSPQQQQQPPSHMPTMQHTVMPFSTHQPAPSQGIVAGTAGVLRF